MLFQEGLCINAEQDQDADNKNTHPEGEGVREEDSFKKRTPFKNDNIAYGFNNPVK